MWLARLRESGFTGGNPGTHIGTLWARTGTQLATVTFANETASGWQQALFTTPVSITVNTTYIASYHAPVGRYSADGNFFATAGVDSPSLHALANGVDGGNGVYAYGTHTIFPSNTYNTENYWVDVVFVPNQKTWTISGTITPSSVGSGATVPLTGASTAAATTDASSNFGFTGLANGSYTVTPTKAGFSFTPANQTVTIHTAIITGVNFTATA